MDFKITKELKIGIWAILVIAATFFGVNYLKGINVFNPTNYYCLKFSRINGLVETNPVNVKGYKVGFVQDIIYDYDDPTKEVVVILQVDEDMKIPVGSRAGLVSGLLGGANIELFMDTTVGEKIYYEVGDTLPSYIDDGVMNALSSELMPRIQSIIPQLDSLMASLQVIANDKAIEKSLANIQTITTNLKGTTHKLDNMMGNDVPTLLNNANALVTKFDKVGEGLAKVDFNKTVNQLNTTLASVQKITDKVNKGEGTLGLLLTDQSLYNNINTTVGSANSLLLDLKSNPKRYVQFSLINRNKEEKEDLKE
jgi:phospholipid/cholesterol/gamma-HCH transport system substrate-binding protein